ncbi:MULTISPECIES: class I SAM-dependent methyltransferase [Halolamina]|uniref:Methyltransferase domain-containing protein n=1 Tax=Halolamina pelagica TaxID=699431 RepID=A0A1I5SZ55_9EURY|nr:MULTISPECIES: class I SAM-dependent methyltransferase [Halolamina]NHX36929.1 class I SAM-dependent methyltransferase [Halolamina sp. R1-12]SFP76049.1 Methyltransferase domain-containing protein [Halolamina pelagica]
MVTDRSDHPTPAELYDCRFQDDPRDDVSFYRDLAVDAGGAVLELACGTGRVHLPLLDAGVDATGIDLDTGRLARLRERATARGLDADVREADMLDFEPRRAYDLVLCPFNTVQHARSVDDQRTLLAQVHDALAPGGQFVFDTFVPSFDVICETDGEWQEEPVQYGGRTYTHRSRSRVVDSVEQQFEVETETEAPHGAVVHESSYRLSMLPKQQVELLARDSPFDSWSVESGFDGGDPDPAASVRPGRSRS